MNEFFIAYISLGIGFYIGLFAVRLDFILKSKISEIIRGLFGIPVWPAMLLLVLIINLNKIYAYKEQNNARF